MSNQKKLQAWLKTRELACDTCGASAKLAIGSTHSKSLKPSVRCMDHIHGLRQVFGFAFGIELDVGNGITAANSAGSSESRTNSANESAKKNASQDDARWFKANPRRTHRIRPTTAPRGGDDSGYMAVVRQIEPGRMTYVVLEPCEETIPDDDDVLGLLFEAVKEQSETTGVQAEVNLYDILSRAVQMKMVGGTA